MATHSQPRDVLQAERRDAAKHDLWRAGIETTLHYPIPLPEIEYHRERLPTDPGPLSCDRRLMTEIMFLPIHSWLKDEHVEGTVGRMTEFYAGAINQGGVSR